jgi:septum formation protein
MKLILGSSSKWRQQVLKKAGYKFSVMHPDIDEKKIRHKDPRKLALAIANTKADNLLPQITDPAVLITTDQVVVCNNKIYEKPESADEARKFMHCYNKHSAKTVTALVVVNTKTGKRVAGVDIVNIYFNPIPESVIEELIAEGEIFTCAGGFQVEAKDGNLSPYIKFIDGAIDSVKGIPLKLLKKLIKRVNF